MNVPIKWAFLCFIGLLMWIGIAKVVIALFYQWQAVMAYIGVVIFLCLACVALAKAIDMVYDYKERVK